MNNLKNRYFLLRHGRNIHQTELANIHYCWPDDTPPVSLLKEGEEQIERAGEILKDKHIDCIYCSDIWRTKQTASIIAKKISFDSEKIIYDERLRDSNWGIFGGKKIDESWKFFNNDHLKRFEIAPSEGESWRDCQKRMIEVLKDIENNNQNKNILIISHGDPLWLLEGYMEGMDTKTLISKEKEIAMEPGELKEIYE
jgi:broad specificity phosphatase PhoE